MYSLFCRTSLTLHFTAPMESACTAFHDDDFLRPVAPAAAHQVAAVDADGGVVAEAAVGALDAQFRVLLAEPGGGFEVDEVLRAGGLVLRVVRLQLEAVLVLPPPADGAFGVGVDAVDAVGQVGVGVGAVGVVATSLAPGVADHHPRSSVEAVLQVIPDDPEGGEAHPAGLDRA